MSIKPMPELSFYATLHWKMASGIPAVHGLSATYIEDAPTSLDSGWIYCSAGDTYSGLKPIGLGLDHVTGRLVGLKFWCECYYLENEAGLSRYRFDIRAFDNQQANNPFQFHSLNLSRNGYLGLYVLGIPDVDNALGEVALWEFDGLDPWTLEEGMQVVDLALISPSGKKLRRLVEDGFPYLNEYKGHDTLFSIQVQPDGLKMPW